MTIIRYTNRHGGDPVEIDIGIPCNRGWLADMRLDGTGRDPGSCGPKGKRP